MSIKKRRLGIWIGRGMVAILALALLAEALLRLSSGLPSPPIFEAQANPAGYGLKADARSQLALAGRSSRISIDENGRRATSGQAREAATKLHLVGDSQTFGWGLDDRETIASRLQALLGPGIEVVNHGVPGYGPLDYVDIVGKLPPDEAVIVLSDEENDLWDAYGTFRTSTINCGHIATIAMPCILHRSYLIQHIVAAVKDWRNRVRPTPIGFSPNSKLAGQLLSARVARRYRDMRDGRPGLTLFALVPWKARFDPQSHASYFPPPYDPADIPRILPDDCDMLAAFTARKNPARLYLQGDSHLGPDGSAILATHLVDCLRSATAQ